MTPSSASAITRANVAVTLGQLSCVETAKAIDEARHSLWTTRALLACIIEDGRKVVFNFELPRGLTSPRDVRGPT